MYLNGRPQFGHKLVATDGAGGIRGQVPALVSMTKQEHRLLLPEYRQKSLLYPQVKRYPAIESQFPSLHRTRIAIYHHCANQNHDSKRRNAYSRKPRPKNTASNVPTAAQTNPPIIMNMPPSKDIIKAVVGFSLIFTNPLLYCPVLT